MFSFRYRFDLNNCEFVCALACISYSSWFRCEINAWQQKTNTNCTLCCAINTEAATAYSKWPPWYMYMRAVNTKRNEKSRCQNKKSIDCRLNFHTIYIFVREKFKFFEQLLRLDAIQYCHKNIAFDAISPSNQIGVRLLISAFTRVRIALIMLFYRYAQCRSNGWVSVEFAT